MQKFEYRTPRYLVDLPVLFSLPNSNIQGRCKEISKEGMKVELQEPVSPETCGIVCIDYMDLSLELRVCVAHAGAGYDGLKFLFESERDRIGVERLVALLSGPTGQPGPVLVR
jgi:hypothetical protein